MNRGRIGLPLVMKMNFVFEEDITYIQDHHKGENVSDSPVLIVDFTSVVWTVVKSSIDKLDLFSYLPDFLVIDDYSNTRVTRTAEPKWSVKDIPTR